jgi:hypothetical protein
MIALTRPGFYFGSLMNVDRYNISSTLGQHALDNNLQRITPTQIHINGLLANGAIERTAGYINWIGDYLTNLGLSSPGVKIKDYLTGKTKLVIVSRELTEEEKKYFLENKKYHTK